MLCRLLHPPTILRHLSTASAAADLLSSLLPCKRRRKLRHKQNSPRNKSIQPHPHRRLPHFESILARDAAFRFLTRAKSHLSRLPAPSLPLSLAGKLHRELGFPRGRKPARSAARHPLLFRLTPQSLSFTPLMSQLLTEEKNIYSNSAVMMERITSIRKLLMISAKHRVPLAKLHHCRLLFGLPDNFRDIVPHYNHFFRVTVDATTNLHYIELADYDPKLALSVLEKDFMTEESRVRRTFDFPIQAGLDEKVSVSSLPLVSPYTDGTVLKPWTVEAEKYRVGVVHEFLHLTLEKRAMIHHIVEFKEEFSLTQHTYQMLLKQPRAFYLAGTEMNWAVFLREAYTEDGVLKHKDPQVVFDEKLRRIASMTEKDRGVVDGGGAHL